LTARNALTGIESILKWTQLCPLNPDRGGQITAARLQGIATTSAKLSGKKTSAHQALPKTISILGKSHSS